MTNKDKYADWLKEHEDDFICGEKFAIIKESGELEICSKVGCRECEFYSNDILCDKVVRKWLYEDADTVDWDKVPVDAKIEVSDDGKVWEKRHFAKFEDGNVYAWSYGGTSFSSGIAILWEHAKLHRE